MNFVGAAAARRGVPARGRQPSRAYFGARRRCRDAARFQRSKGAGEEALVTTEGLEVVIVRPSLVMGPGGASGDFFSALAALPIPPRLGSGEWRVQPLHVTELANLIVKLALEANPPRSVDAVGPAPVTTDDLTSQLRGWLGLGESARSAAIAGALGALAWANEIVEAGPGDREFVALAERGNFARPRRRSPPRSGRPPLQLRAKPLALNPPRSAISGARGFISYAAASADAGVPGSGRGWCPSGCSRPPSFTLCSANWA